MGRLFAALVMLFVSLPSWGSPSYHFVQKVAVRADVHAYEYKLRNGLTVVLMENKRAPTVSIFHWVKTGSLHEKKGITGMAHLFEHMMFRPLKKGESGFFDKLKKLGGSGNANTRFGATVYNISVPSSKVGESLLLESQRFQNLVVTDKLLKLEKEAVRSEYVTSMDTNPIVDLWDRIYKEGFKGHPFGWMIVGFRKDLDRINAEQCNDFFSKYYKPNNVGIFVSGDISHGKVLKDIVKFYGKWERGEDSHLPRSYVAGRKKTRIKVGKLKASSRNLLVGYYLPPYNKKNFNTINFINHIVFESKFSLMKKLLVHKLKWASEVSGFNHYYDRGLLKAMVVLYPEASFNRVLGQFKEIPKILKNMSAEEWQAYIKEFKIEISEGVLKNVGLTGSVALYWGKFGNIRFLPEMLRDFSPTKEEVIEFTDRYLRPDNMIAVRSRK